MMSEQAQSDISKAINQREGLRGCNLRRLYPLHAHTPSAVQTSLEGF